VLLDAGAQHSGRTGREVLTLTALVLGVPEDRVDELLGTVGLAGRPAGKRVGQYSLGMRQRLGLAAALLGDPQVLVLDEPANGLDPEGIFWMRGLLRDFADRGGTVLASSHLLREVEAVADQLVVIARGRIVAQGRQEELLAARGTLVRGPDRSALERALATAGIAVRPGTGDALVADAPVDAVGRAVAAAGAVVTELRPGGGEGLEELFRSLTSAGATEVAA
jgi:ABC-2 type transport system ATP-binding protein